MQGKFFLFVNVKQAATFGHVGWGFLLNDGKTYCFGATDHLYRHHNFDLLGWIDYMNVPAGEHTDWWCDYGDEEKMLTAMSHSHHHIWYHYCRSIDVKHAKPEAAEKVAKSLELAGWALLNNNCVQQTWEIVKAYGAGAIIPDPWGNPFQLIPRVWFNSFKGDVKVLREP